MVDFGNVFQVFNKMQEMNKINALLDKQKHSQNNLSDEEKVYVVLPVNDKKAVADKTFLGRVNNPKKVANATNIAVNYYITNKKTIYVLPRLKPRKHEAENGDTTYHKHEWFEFYL